MLLRLTCLLVVLLSAPSHLAAQMNCGTDVKHGEMMSNPVNKRKYDNMNAAIRARTSRAARTASTVYTIPVVFHFMHRGEPMGSGVNLTDEKVYYALKQVNERYRKIPGSIGDNTSIDMQVQFALAVRDPNGNPTTGVNRVDMTGYQNYMDHGVDVSPGMDADMLRGLSFWDSHRYLNIWIVSYAYGYGGFAHYADAHGTPYDGVILTPGMLNGPDYSGIVHELGHYLNLAHTFEGWDGVNCPPNNDCLMTGDLVCDTPPQAINASCVSAPNDCAPGEELAAINYMSYSCLEEFTPGQKTRVLDAITIRSSLLEENGNMALVPAAAPVPDFRMGTDGLCLLAGSDVQLIDRTAFVANVFNNSFQSTNTSFAWTMTNNDDITLTSAEQNPTFTIPANGSYDVTLKVTTPQGTSSITKQDFLVAEGVSIPAPNCEAITNGSVDYLIRTDDVGIREVILGDLHHISGTSVEDAAARITNLNGYADFSCSQVARLNPFTVYTMNVRVSDVVSEHVHVYIDADNNGITSSDLVTYAHNIPPASGLFELPPFGTPIFPVFNTPLRMRVIDVNVDGNEIPPDACGFIGYYGQIHDFTVIFPNELAIAVDDAVTINEDENGFIDVLANDADPDGYILPSSIDLDRDPNIHFFPVMNTPEGQWTVPASNLKFVPKPNYNGVATITYTVTDNRYTESAPATVKVTVNPVNDPPVFIKGADQTIPEKSGPQMEISWATGISPGPPDESMQEVEFIVTNNNNLLFVTQPSIDAAGTLTYTPAGNLSGVATVTVRLRDNGGSANGGVDTSPAQQFTILVDAVNDAPHAGDDIGATLEDHDVTINVAVNDSDVDDAIDKVSIDLDPARPGIQKIFTHEGIWTVDDSGGVTYSPSQNFYGPVSISYTLSDERGAVSNIATISIVVEGVNDPPVVIPYAATVLQGETLTGNFSVGDTDPDGTVTYRTVPLTSPMHGTISIQADGYFTYSPDDSFVGTEFIMVNACDDGTPVLCTGKSVTITVEAVTGVTDSPEGIVIYPNPSSGKFTVQVPVGGRARNLKIVDLLGNIVHESKIENLKTIDLTTHALGVYLVMIDGVVLRWIHAR